MGGHLSVLRCLSDGQLYDLLIWLWQFCCFRNNYAWWQRWNTADNLDKCYNNYFLWVWLHHFVHHCTMTILYVGYIIHYISIFLYVRRRKLICVGHMVRHNYVQKNNNWGRRWIEMLDDLTKGTENYRSHKDIAQDKRSTLIPVYRLFHEGRERFTV